MRILISIFLSLLLCGCSLANTVTVSGTLTAGNVVVGTNSTAGIIVESSLSIAVTNLIASTVSGSANVSIVNPGTNVFHVGQTVELFGAGPTTHGTQGLIALIQSVSAGTNLGMSQLAGVTSTNIACVIGSNNMTQLRADEALAEASPPTTIFLAQSGPILAFDAALYDPAHTFPNEYSALPGITIANGVTWLGTNGTTLLSAGALMYYPVASIGGGGGGFLKYGSTLFWETPSATPQYSVNFINLGIDGGAYAGAGTAAAIPSHTGFLQFWDGNGNGQFAYLRKFDGCTIANWMGEALKSTVTTGGTGTSFLTTNCTWLDCNFTCENFTFGGTNVNDHIDTAGQIAEQYQAYATCPTVWNNVTFTNLLGNGFAVNGALAAQLPQPIIITGVTGRIPHNDYFFVGTPCANVTITNCDVRCIDPANQGYGIIWTSSGEQPQTGASDWIQNTITGNNFHDLFTDFIILISGSAYNNALSNNVAATGHGFAVVEVAGFLSNNLFYGNSCTTGINSHLLSSGQYFYDDLSDVFGANVTSANNGDEIFVPVDTGARQNFNPTGTGAAYVLQHSDSNSIPTGAGGKLFYVVGTNTSAFPLTFFYNNETQSTNLAAGAAYKQVFTNGSRFMPSN